jgi:hypothetical protein
MAERVDDGLPKGEFEVKMCPSDNITIWYSDEQNAVSMWTDLITQCNTVATWDADNRATLTHIQGGYIKDVEGFVVELTSRISVPATIITGGGDGASDFAVQSFEGQFQQKLNDLLGEKDLTWVRFVTNDREDRAKNLNPYSFVITTEGKYGRVKKDEPAAEGGEDPPAEGGEEPAAEGGEEGEAGGEEQQQDEEEEQA